jgi:hypothetical protein
MWSGVVEGGKAFAVKELGGGIAGFCGKKERIKEGTRRDRVGNMEERKTKEKRHEKGWKKWYRRG